MTNTLYLPELREMLAENNTAELQEFCVALHPARTAEFMEGLTAAEAWDVLQHADETTRAEIFSYFDRDKQVEIIESAERADIGRLIADLPPDDRVDILKSVRSEIVGELLPFIPAFDRRDILRLQSYPEGTAGAMMTTGFAKLGEGLTVKQALEAIEAQAQELETIYYVYIVDAQDHLRGLVSARQLLSAIGKPLTKIDDLMERDLVTVDVTDDQEKVAQDVARFDLHAIPVVDGDHHMLGIITHDDVIDVFSAEATEDVYRMGAVAPLEENYLEADFRTIWWKRSVWLSCLFVAEIFTFTAIAHFDDAIKKVVALAMFLPLCISTGGNSGSQAATLITRAMALGQVTLGDWWRVLRHELAMGLALGCTLGCVGFLRAYFTPKKVLGDSDPVQFAVVISLAVTAICLWGTLVGSMLPLMFRRFGFDPGYASSPFVATFVDVTGIVILFSLAQAFLLVPV
ncbi:MAG: magnesium transporter [Planctomycetia bacterium]|nr:magnesium transporter [Planctomycetia bacterium]